MVLIVIGGSMMVANSVSQYIRAGVAGFHIEDQTQNKCCGHLQGMKVVFSAEEFFMRIQAIK
jgi:methylisocitrate lyase